MSKLTQAIAEATARVRAYAEVTAEVSALPASIWQWERFAIRHIPTGRFLPERWRKGRGYSHDEPSFGFPRLFPSERSAKQALIAWLQGEWKEDRSSINDDGDFDTCGPEPTEVKGRLRSEMEIVRMRVTCGEVI